VLTILFYVLRSFTSAYFGQDSRECECRHSDLHHQTINTPIVVAQAFIMDYTKKTGHNPHRGPSAGWWVLPTAYTSGTVGLTCLPKHAGARDNKFLVTHPMTDQRCFASVIARRTH
jgi:hypothetical protein